MLRCPAVRRTLIVRFRRVAMFSGPCAVRILEGVPPAGGWGSVLGEGGVADEVEPVLDGPLRSGEPAESFG